MIFLDDVKIEPSKNVDQNNRLHRHYVPPVTARVLQQIRKRIKLDNRAIMIVCEMLLYFTFVAVVFVVIFGHRNINETFMVTHATENMFTSERTGFSKVNVIFILSTNNLIILPFQIQSRTTQTCTLTTISTVGSLQYILSGKNQ